MENIGILDPTGININPLNNKPYSEEYKTFAKSWSKLPAYSSAKEIINGIKENQVVLLNSGTGSGKTVLLPKFALHALNYQAKIAITLPKQIVAQSAAEYAALTLDVKLGEEVGYKYKGSDKSAYSKDNKLLYATDGTIVAKLLKDQKLSEFDAVIIDEAHERKVQIDFLLYLLKETLIVRPEFKLIIMSATVNEEVFENYFNTFKFIKFSIGTKPNYPIESIFLDKPLNENYLNKGYEIIKKIMNEDKITDQNKNDAHDILFFVVSSTEAKDICMRVNNDKLDGYCIEVFSNMPKDKQEFAQDKTKYKSISKKSRKIIIATNVAESSLTIDGIKYVIDSGNELFGYYNPETHARALDKKLITQAQAKQRMGRSGRTESGICYHLYTQHDFDKMEKYPEPSIRVSNVYTECLKLLAIENIHTVPNLLNILNNFIEPPKEKYVKDALKQLTQLGIIENDALSILGKFISQFQLEPMEAISCILAYKLGCVNEVLSIISLVEATKGNLSELFVIPSDIIKPTEDNKKQLFSLNDKFTKAKLKLRHKYGDHLTLLTIFNKFRKHKEADGDKLEAWTYKYFLKLSALEKAHKTYRKMKQNTMHLLHERKLSNIPEYDKMETDDKVLLSIAYGFRLNMAFLKDKDKLLYSTNYVQNVKPKRESFILVKDNIPGQVVYNELFSFNGSNELNIISRIPVDIVQKIENITLL
jgi:pre-mRNA-splicing factor ATP-dependent RNA helicase DHX15/PRP43